mmetsp:Transcript_18810/g.27050  ORF Transcript_18810/g.27050 Transcript_18810/m.27050 type:complete len:255 (+) Transcript_18810:329-1093(+)
MKTLKSPHRQLRIHRREVEGINGPQFSRRQQRAKRNDLQIGNKPLQNATSRQGDNPKGHAIAFRTKSRYQTHARILKAQEMMMPETKVVLIERHPNKNQRNHLCGDRGQRKGSRIWSWNRMRTKLISNQEIPLPNKSRVARLIDQLGPLRLNCQSARLLGLNLNSQMIRKSRGLLNPKSALVRKGELKNMLRQNQPMYEQRRHRYVILVDLNGELKVLIKTLHQMTASPSLKCTKRKNRRKRSKSSNQLRRNAE